MSAEKVIVRKATIADLELLLELSTGLLEHDANFDATLDKSWAKGPHGREMFINRITKNDGVVYIAEVANKVVGYIIGGLIEPDTFRNIKTMADLEEIFVDSNYRHYHVGSVLMENFHEWCKAQLVEKLSVSVYAQNQNAIKFYKKVGFVEAYITLEMPIV